jgi:hypothetical protein
MTIRTAFYAQSGGVTAAGDASARNVTRMSRKHRGYIGTVFAEHNGLTDAPGGNLIDPRLKSGDPSATGHPAPFGPYPLPQAALLEKTPLREFIGKDSFTHPPSLPDPVVLKNTAVLRKPATGFTV